MIYLEVLKASNARSTSQKEVSMAGRNLKGSVK